MRHVTAIVLLLCLALLTACGSSAVQTTVLVIEAYTEDGVAYVATETGPGQAEVFQLAAPVDLASGATYCVTTTPPVGDALRVIVAAMPCDPPPMVLQIATQP